MTKNSQCFLLILCLAILLLYFHNMSSARTMKELQKNSKVFQRRNLIFSHNLSELDKLYCKNISKLLNVTVEIKHKAPLFSERKALADSIFVGGEYMPVDCDNPDHVAIIVPYRDRADQLPVFLGHIHPFLMLQSIHYRIYLVNQQDNNQFNRAVLMNVGFKESLKDFNWTCFIFHDVDTLPEDVRNLYSCPDQPRHMAVALDRWNYKPLGPAHFGGVVALRREHFQKINGLSNQFWGWGGEDDDMGKRVLAKGLKITRYSAEIARYTTIKHEQAKMNPDRMKVLKQVDGSFRSESDGLSNLAYKLISSDLNDLYTNITVNLKE